MFKNSEALSNENGGKYNMINIISGVKSRVIGGMAALLMGGMSVFSFAHAESVLKIIPHADLKNLDPIWTTAYISRNHGYMIYDTLFAMDETFTPDSFDIVVQ